MGLGTSKGNRDEVKDETTFRHAQAEILTQVVHLMDEKYLLKMASIIPNINISGATTGQVVNIRKSYNYW